MEYASVAWSPHTAKDISAIESIQRRAARFVLNDYSRNSSVSAVLADLNWQSLEERRIINDLAMFYKIDSNFVNISFPAEISLGFQGTRRSHDYKIMPLSSSVNAYKYMLFTGREVRMGKNCARGLEYGPRPKAEGRAQDQGHSFFPIRTDLDR